MLQVSSVGRTMYSECTHPWRALYHLVLQGGGEDFPLIPGGWTSQHTSHPTLSLPFLVIIFRRGGFGVKSFPRHVLGEEFRRARDGIVAQSKSNLIRQLFDTLQ